MQEITFSEHKNGSVTVEDILGIDDILGINAMDSISSAESFMDEISEEPDEEAINSMPLETIQKNPDKIEELTIPQTAVSLEEVREEKPRQTSFGIEELNTAEEIAKKLSPKPAPAPAPAPAPKPIQEPVREAAPIPEPKPVSKPSPISEIVSSNGAEMSLEDFETAVKRLKTQLDNGEITESEFAVEKKKLSKLLY